MTSQFLRSFGLAFLLLSCSPQSGAYTRLMRAAASGEEHSVRELLSGGEDPNASDEKGNTALSLAAQFGRAPVVEILLEHGASADSLDMDGLTPLMKAARAGHAKVVEMLVGAGADPARRDREGKTASDWAKAGRNEDVLRALEATER